MTIVNCDQASVIINGLWPPSAILSNQAFGHKSAKKSVSKRRVPGTGPMMRDASLDSYRPGSVVCNDMLNILLFCCWLTFVYRRREEHVEA